MLNAPTRSEGAELKTAEATTVLAARYLDTDEELEDPMKRRDRTRLALLCTLLFAGVSALTPDSARATPTPAPVQVASFQSIQPNFAAQDTAALDDGRVVVFGVSGTEYVFARYSGDGQPDPTFGNGGEVRLPGAEHAGGQGAGGDSAGAMRLVVQADGRLLALAQHSAVRLLPGGQLDTAFGQGGWVTSSLPVQPQAIAALPDGRVLIAGGTRSLSPDPLAPTAAVVLWRLLPSGRPDPSFGTDGQVVTPMQASAAAYSLLPLPDGEVVVAGTALSFSGGTYSRWVAARYTAAGTLSPTFGQGGLATVREDRFAATRPSSLAVDGQGRILIAGVLSSGLCALARLLPDGRADPDWRSEISSDLRTSAADSAGSTISLAVLPGGDVVLGGCAQARLTASGQETTQPVVVRLEPDGQPRQTFGEAGLLNVPDSARLTLTPQGRLLTGLNPVTRTEIIP